MAQVTFTINDAFLPDFIATVKWLYPVPKDVLGNPLFTDNQWAKEAVRRWMISQVKRYKDYLAKEAVNTIVPDDNVS